MQFGNLTLQFSPAYPGELRRMHRSFGLLHFTRLTQIGKRVSNHGFTGCAGLCVGSERYTQFKTVEITLKNYTVLNALVASAAVACVSNAHSQNSVTLYGRIDNGIAFVNHASGNQDLIAMRHGLSNSRFGFKGTEDLGGGVNAIFQLENGFNESTGALGNGGRMFGRQAFLGLTSNTAGTVTLGRQYDPLVDMIQPITADNTISSVSATPGDVDNYDNSLRVSNSIKYTSPKFAGFQMEGLYGFGNNAGGTGQGATYSGALSYSAGNLSAAAGYFRATNPSPTTGKTRDPSSATNAWVNASSDPLFDSIINNGYITAKSVEIARAAAQYVIGSLTVGAGYSNSAYKSDGSSTFTGDERFNAGSVFSTYQFSPAITAGAGYSYMRAYGNTSATYNQASLGLLYFLSKRTNLYVVGGYQHASGTQLVQHSNGTTSTQTAQASLGSFGYAGTSNQALVIVGLRTGF